MQEVVLIFMSTKGKSWYSCHQGVFIENIDMWRKNAIEKITLECQNFMSEIFNINIELRAYLPQSRNMQRGIYYVIESYTMRLVV